jgi:hypothetical protein
LREREKVLLWSISGPGGLLLKVLQRLQSCSFIILSKTEYSAVWCSFVAAVYKIPGGRGVRASIDSVRSGLDEEKKEDDRTFACTSAKFVSSRNKPCNQTES